MNIKKKNKKIKKHRSTRYFPSFNIHGDELKLSLLSVNYYFITMQPLFLPFFHIPNIYVYIFFHSHLHGDVLQRALRHVLHSATLRLLSVLGAQLGVQEEGHH